MDNKEQPNELWCVTRAYNFTECISIPILPYKLKIDEGMPKRFMPIFDNYDDAVAWTNGDTTYIKKLKVVPQDE